MTDDWWLIIRKLIKLRKFLIIDDWLLMTDDWLLIVDCLHTDDTDDTDGHGGPQAEGVGERESSEFKRNLNGGPQADEVRIQVTINDDWLLIIDYWWLIADYWLYVFRAFVVGGG